METVSCIYNLFLSIQNIFFFKSELQTGTENRKKKKKPFICDGTKTGTECKLFLSYGTESEIIFPVPEMNSKNIFYFKSLIYKISII